MKYSTIIKHLASEFEKAKENKLVRKPLSFALYQTWKWCDTYEKEKKNDGNQG